MKDKVFIFILIFASSLFAQTTKVHTIIYDGAINPSCSDYIQHGIKKAASENSECLIIQLNTPGGLLKSTRIIVTEFLQSPIPIVVYVAPSGSQSASAGVFITMASHIAVMAPGTNIGAAHPVSLQGEMDSIMSEKSTNDAAAFIRTISEKRKRNMHWAEDAVRNSVSITETEAVDSNVINFIANNLSDLLNKLDGIKVETVKGISTLSTKDAEVIFIEMTFTQKLLSILSDPNIAYILFMLGIYGLLFELYSPGAIFPGVIGGICLILAFYSLHTLPINYAGLALIIFAIILFVLEIKIISHGLLSIGGTISLILGSLMLIDSDSGLEVVTISWQIIALIVVLTLLFFLFAIGLGIKAQRLKPTTGPEGIVNETGKAITSLNPNGSVKVHGEIWDAESIGGDIEINSNIVVTGISNLKLKVKKIM
jgi:membrane-bound serine protease (ClpP class)